MFSLVFAAILVLVIGSSYRILKFRLEDNLRQELRERAAGLRGYFHFKEDKPVFEYNVSDPDEAFFVETSTRYYQIFNHATGDLIDQSHEADLLDIDTDPEKVRGIKNKVFSEAESGSVRLLFYNEVVRAPGAKEYLMQIGLRRDFVDSALWQFLGMAAAVIPVSLAVAAVACWWIAGRALQPVNLLARAANEIGISDLDRRLPMRGTGDELDRLSGTFNEMFGRLAKAIGEMKQFTASISHELRTPLTALRGEAEVMLIEPHSEAEYRKLLASNLEEYDRLSRLINKLLTLARAESGDIQMHPEKIDLAGLTRFLIEQLDTVAASRQVSLVFRPGGPTYINADREWIETAILNLLDNAIKYTRPGGTVTAVAENQGDQSVLQIDDTGIGITADALPHIFERFYRADPSHSGSEGSGLGLNLVQWIVAQHHGAIEVRSVPEKGSSFRLSFPTA